MPEWITRSQHSDTPSACGQDGFSGKRHRPGLPFGASLHQLQVPWAANDNFGPGQRLTACIIQAFQSIFAQTDDR